MRQHWDIGTDQYGADLGESGYKISRTQLTDGMGNSGMKKISNIK